MRACVQERMYHMLEDLPDVAACGHLWLGVSEALAAVWDRCLVLPPCIGHPALPKNALRRSIRLLSRDCSDPTAYKYSFRSLPGSAQCRCMRALFMLCWHHRTWVYCRLHNPIMCNTASPFNLGAAKASSRITLSVASKHLLPWNLRHTLKWSYVLSMRIARQKMSTSKWCFQQMIASPEEVLGRVCSIGSHEVGFSWPRGDTVWYLCKLRDAAAFPSPFSMAASMRGQHVRGLPHCLT